MNKQAGNFSWLHFQPLLDSALPIGAFSHSFGLETMVQTGRIHSLNDLEDFCKAMLIQSWAPTDALLIKAVYQFAEVDDWQSLWALDHRMHVQRAARETREGMQKMGRRLLHLGQEIYPELPWFELTEAVRSGKCPASYPLVHGWIAYQLGVSLDQAAESFLYNSVMNMINCALRLMAIGQTQGQRLLLRLLDDCIEAWHTVRELEPFNFYNTSPILDVAMMQHETLYSRLFMS